MAAVTLHLKIEGQSFLDAHGQPRPVLGRIELTIQAGQVVALVGPSGCGKTTLLRIAGGLEDSFQGSRSLDNAARIGSVFQEPRLLAWRTVRRNVLLAQTEENAAVADAFLAALDLAPFTHAYPRTLSLGMARRVAIARALAVEPDLLLLDEPFASLDPAMTQRVHALLRTVWRSRPVTTLLVTHDRAEAKALADRVVVLGGSPATIQEDIVTEPH